MPSLPYSPGQGGNELTPGLRLLRDFQAALGRDDRAAAIEYAAKIVSQRLQLGPQWIPLALTVLQNGEVSLAKRAIDVHVEQCGGDQASLARKAALLASAGLWGEAQAILRALDTPPDRAVWAYSRGTAALYLGDEVEAREWLEEALRLQPGLGAAWNSLAMLLDLGEEDELVARMEAAGDAVGRFPVSEKASWHYALGKARHDRRDYAGAFEAFASGAAIMRSTLDYSRERDDFTARDAVEGYDPGAIAELAARQSEPTGRAIFVLGLPRSGTTLIEQVLTSHSEVRAGDEINRLPLLLKDIGGLSLPAVRRYVDAKGAPTAAKLWEHWLDERFPEPGRVVDKTFNSSRLLGLAATLLPEAPLVWLRRDPLDCAWSCFRSRFVGGANWSYDLDDIAYHFMLEDLLLDQWRTVLGDRLMVIDFEAFVSDPAPHIARLLAHCGLKDEAAPYSPHENRRLVTTSSMMQVRKPINRKGIGVAEPYRAFLEPFVTAYRG